MNGNLWNGYQIFLNKKNLNKRENKREKSHGLRMIDAVGGSR